jgi:DNA-directed RNA polymerase subunit RPC12/RpoP
MPEAATRPPEPRMAQARLKEYRCKQCSKLLFEAVQVRRLSKRCPRCKFQNLYDE